MFKLTVHSVILIALVIMFCRPAPAMADRFIPVSLTGALSAPSKHTPSWIAYVYLGRNKKTLGIRNPRKDLVVTEVRDNGAEGSQVAMQRILFGTPVWGDGLRFDIDRLGVIRRISGHLHPELEKKLFYRAKHPAVSFPEAIRTANEWLLSHHQPAAVIDAKLYYLPTRPGNPLVYMARIGGPSDPHRVIVVHALTGRVIKADT